MGHFIVPIVWFQNEFEKSYYFTALDSRLIMKLSIGISDASSRPIRR